MILRRRRREVRYAPHPPGESREVVDSAADVLETLRWVLGVSRVSAALALMARIESEGDIPFLRHLSRVISRCLFLDTTKRVRDRQCRICLRFIEVGRSKQNSGHTRGLIGKRDSRLQDGQARTHNSLLSRS